MKTKILDIIFFVVGSFMVIFNLFPQGDKRVVGESYYSGDQITFLALGIAMLVFGFLIRIWRKENEKT